jgi:hypothetical protein
LTSGLRRLHRPERGPDASRDTEVALRKELEANGSEAVQTSGKTHVGASYQLHPRARVGDSDRSAVRDATDVSAFEARVDAMHAESTTGESAEAPGSGSKQDVHTRHEHSPFVHRLKAARRDFGVDVRSSGVPNFCFEADRSPNRELRTGHDDRRILARVLHGACSHADADGRRLRTVRRLR